MKWMTGVQKRQMQISLPVLSPLFIVLPSRLPHRFVLSYATRGNHPRSPFRSRSRVTGETRSLRTRCASRYKSTRSLDRSSPPSSSPPPRRPDPRAPHDPPARHPAHPARYFLTYKDFTNSRAGSRQSARRRPLRLRVRERNAARRERNARTRHDGREFCLSR